MRIAIEAQRLFRKKKHGMDIVALELIRNLQKIDTQNEYFIFVKPDEDKCIQSTENFHVIELKGATYPYWEQVALPAAVKKYNCDILHCTSNTAPLESPVPLIVTLHDIIYLEKKGIMKHGGTLYQKFGNMYRKWNVPRIINKASKIITVSGYEKNVISEKIPAVKDKLDFVYNGVGSHFKCISDFKFLERIRRAYNLPERFILHFGNTAPKKNTPAVIRAYAKYFENEKIPLPLVLIDLKQESLDKILEENKLSHLAPYIHLLDYIENKDLPAIYNLSSLFLYPSLRESFGIPILEGMSCGVPVLTSNVSSMPEIAGDAAYLVDPKNEDEMAEAISKILNDSHLSGTLSIKGLERAMNFSWKNMAMNVMDIYQQQNELVLKTIKEFNHAY